jgi:hypothetical protein
MGMRFFYFLLGAVFFFSCAGAVSWPYRFYHITPTGVWDFPNARLLGAKESDDYDLSRCKPTRKNNKGQLIQECVVVFYPELNRLVADYKKSKQDLIDCQRGR